MQHTDIPLTQQSATLGLHHVAHNLLLISHPAKGRRLSRCDESLYWRLNKPIWDEQMRPQMSNLCAVVLEEVGAFLVGCRYTAICTISLHPALPLNVDVSAASLQFTWSTSTSQALKVKGAYSSQSYGVSPAIRDHTVLPATRHKWTHRALTRPVLDLPTPEGWKAELT